MTLKFLK
ncbi:hypothetical protein AYI68_g3297, partial [Smittium mucronatum]